MRRDAGALLLAGLLLGCAGCGLQIQDEAVPLPPGALETILPKPSETIGVRLTSVYFVSGRELEAVPQPVSDRTPAGVMAAIAAGPPVDRQAQLRTLLLDPLTAQPVLSVTDVTDEGEVRLRRTDEFLNLPATDQVLLVGQIVLSMAEIGLSQVVVTNDSGQPVPVSLPDGRVKEDPVTAEDYEELVAD